MKLKKLIDRVKSPCAKCLYNRLDMFKMPRSFCKQCKMNGYQSYELFLKPLSEMQKE